MHGADDDEAQRWVLNLQEQAFAAQFERAAFVGLQDLTDAAEGIASTLIAEHVCG
jgi:hypothetical protein